MNNKYTFKMLSLIVIILILVLSVLSSTAEAEHEQQYNTAIGLMYDLQNQDNLTQAQDMFAEMGTYRNSKHFHRYLNAIISLYNDDLETAEIILNALSGFPVFAAELESRYLPSCDALLEYSSARKLEQAEDYAEAIQLYTTCDVLDSVDRVIALAGVTTSTVQQQQTTIIQKIEEEENNYFNNDLVLSAKNSSGGISLSWNKLPEAVQYHIFWRVADETEAPYKEVKTKIKSNSFLHAGKLRSGVEYTYYITAVDRQGHTLDSNHVDIKRVYIKPPEPQSSTSDSSSGSSTSSPGTAPSSSSQSMPDPQHDEIVLPPFDD